MPPSGLLMTLSGLLMTLSGLLMTLATRLSVNLWAASVCWVPHAKVRVVIHRCGLLMLLFRGVIPVADRELR
ncbi:MAG: uncharacterized protein KVP18_000792 [Porospora cf. gigantea A]|uniref:uncharacterized protein n=1 Tax=Porospora cf. gigantea A TaxID=2853593 RepID=UPI00355A0889|nr:MAG: hypothetical protein KVP18_000792 [Porospora cf. gigantea A]